MAEVFSGQLADAATEGGTDADLAMARAGDDAAFARLVGPLRRDLHAHCYRMLGSGYDADDALQDALLRAWRGLARFEGRSSLRSWLYTVATHSCLDVIEHRGKRALPIDLGPSSEGAVLDQTPLAEIAWLGPYPDAGLADSPAGPYARYEQRETIELAFVAALQHLPGNQRAALLLFEVLGFSAAEIAAMMATSTTSVNSALARARKIVAERVPSPTQQQTLRQIGDARLREIVTRYATALERGDAEARKLAPPPSQRERPAGRGFLPWQRPLQPAPRLVDHSAEPARRAHRRNHVVPRAGPLRALRAACLTTLTQGRARADGVMS